jgi:hypothetical protein
MAVGESDENSTKKLQLALNKIAIWTKKGRIELNESKSVHIDFKNKRITQQNSCIICKGGYGRVWGGW